MLPVRTPKLERPSLKYNERYCYGKRFSEIYGLVSNYL